MTDTGGSGVGMPSSPATRSIPARKSSRIAPLGKTLQDLIDALLQWSAAQLPEVQRARDRFDAAEG